MYWLKISHWNRMFKTSAAIFEIENMSWFDLTCVLKNLFTNDRRLVYRWSDAWSGPAERQKIQTLLWPTFPPLSPSPPPSFGTKYIPRFVRYLCKCVLGHVARLKIQSKLHQQLTIFETVSTFLQEKSQTMPLTHEIWKKETKSSGLRMILFRCGEPEAGCSPAFTPPAPPPVCRRPEKFDFTNFADREVPSVQTSYLLVLALL